MSSSIYIASAVVVAASLAIVGLGTAYHWDFASRAYNRWTRVTGAATVLALAVIMSWDRMDDLPLALGILVGGTSLAAVFVWAHGRLSARIESALGGDGDDDAPAA